jgi:glycosyltransferase involved in cell wall biosynthesis
LHPKKGLESFIEIFLQLANTADYRQWRLVVAGDGEPDYVASLKRLIHQQRGEDKIFFAGWLGGLDKMVALRGAALLALPSRQENFGLVVAEALACGTPVLVSTQVNLADEITAAKAGWVAPLERAAWLETLSHVLRDDDERARRGLAGRELAQARFTWPGVATELARLYGAIKARA